jgi:hypothetical protein
MSHILISRSVGKMSKAASTSLHLLYAAGGGALMGAALARAVPRDYWDRNGALLLVLLFKLPPMPHSMKLPAAVATAGAFVGYNCMRHTPWCQ